MSIELQKACNGCIALCGTDPASFCSSLSRSIVRESVFIQDAGGQPFMVQKVERDNVVGHTHGKSAHCANPAARVNINVQGAHLHAEFKGETVYYIAAGDETDGDDLINKSLADCPNHDPQNEGYDPSICPVGLVALETVIYRTQLIEPEQTT